MSIFYRKYFFVGAVEKNKVFPSGRKIAGVPDRPGKKHIFLKAAS
jgi:hypothetical protein